MNIWLVVGIATGLAMDAFAVAFACSAMLRRVSPRQIFRFSFHFGLFQALMPLAGWLAGSSVSRFIVAWDHWIAFILLAGIGGRTIHAALKGNGQTFITPDPTRGWSLVFLSLATSIDAFAVGLSLAMLGVEIAPTVLIIGLVTATLVIAGMLIGGRIGANYGRAVEIIGGLILIGIGVRILMIDLFAG